MRTEVEVTQQDYDEGTPMSPCCCALALALRRALGRDVAVGSTYFEFLDKTGNGIPGTEVALPHIAQRIVKGYDSPLTRYDLEPCKFFIEVPESVA